MVEPTPPPSSAGEPDVVKLVAMVAGAALSAVALLGAVVTLPIGWILAASLVPVVLWAILLREIHRLLRFRGAQPEYDAERDDRPWHL